MKKFRVASTITLSFLAVASLSAGLMDPAIGVVTYRDFAENRGPFQPGARSVPIVNLAGEVVGDIPVVPDFDCVIDPGWAALVSHPSFIATVAHNNSRKNISFARRFGADQVPFLDLYDVVAYNRLSDDPTLSGHEYDHALPRFNKIVTEVEPVPFFFKANYDGPEDSYLEIAKNLFTVRAGGGSQAYATAKGKEEGISGSYQFITGGTILFTQTTETKDPHIFNYRNWLRPADAESPLPIGAKGGDSGSPNLIYNPTTERFEFLAASQSGGDAGFGKFSQSRGAVYWQQEVIDAYASRITDAGGAPLLWNVNATGRGTLIQNGSPVGEYVGLPNHLRGATSEVAADGTSTAYPEEGKTKPANKWYYPDLDATKNLEFVGDGATITLNAALDLGAGSMSFHADYTLTGARLNSAGMIVKEGAMVTTELTGIEGDEWRKVGPGTLVIGGSGENPVKLNTGGGGLTVLDRREGSAVSRVKINGDTATTVRLAAADQIAGANGSAETVVFGHRGGSLDLFGLDATWDGITHLDRGATILNTKPGDVSTFTFTGSGEQVYLGGFHDGGYLSHGLLNVVYDGGKNSKWTLHGENTNKGRWTVASGTVEIAGRPTPLAGGRSDGENWEWATLNSGVVTIKNGATVILGKGANVASDFYIEQGGSLVIGSSILKFTGRVLTEAPAAEEESFSQQ